VESVFAESIIALVDGDLAAARDVRQEDYKAHRAWLQADKISVDLLAGGGLSLDGVQMVCAAIKTALDLKMMADEGMRISQLIRLCSAEKLSRGAATDVIPRMAEITQGMLSDVTGALVNRSPVDAQRLHSASVTLETLNKDLFDHLAADLGAAKLPANVALALVLVGRAFADMGRYALDIAGHVPTIHVSRPSLEAGS
jgi:phosphate uptake regulator